MVTRTVEAVYEYQLARAVAETDAAALRTAGGLVLTGNAHITTVNENHPADIYVERGNLECGGSGRIEGSVYVADGAARLTGSCPIFGDLVVRGDIVIDQGSEIWGDVVSTEGSVVINGGVRISGNAFTSHDFIRTNGRVQGTAYVGRNASFSGAAPAIATHLYYGGTVTYAYGSASNWVLGGTPQRQDTSGIPRPLLPEEPPFLAVTVQNIVDNGFAEVAWEGACAMGGNVELNPFFSEVIPSFRSRTLVQALTCDPWQTRGGIELRLRTDVVVVAKRFNLSNVRISSADGEPHKIWFVVPAEANCAVDGVPEIDVQGTVKFPDGKITALAYTECEVVFGTSGNDPWPGSVYARTFTGYAAIRYVPIGLPVAAGEDANRLNPDEGALGSLVSQRNLR